MTPPWLCGRLGRTDRCPTYVHILLRILAGIAGALLLYVAFFLYEDEEARIQNRLEQIWQRIDALQSSAMSREAAFLQGVTRTTSAILTGSWTQTAIAAIHRGFNGVLDGFPSCLDSLYALGVVI